MLDNTLLFKSLESQVDKMITELELVGKLTDHPGEKGRENEGILKRCLEIMIPKSWEIASGFVVNPKINLNNDGKATGQTDIMIYNSHAAPPIFTGYQNNIIPIHSLACTIEVKTKLKDVKQLIKECLIPAENIKNIYEEVREENKVLKKPEGKSPLSILFCYKSKMTLKKIEEKLNERKNPATDHYHKSAIDMVVVLDRGIVYRNGNKYYSVHACYIEGTKFKETSRPLPDARPWVFNEFYAELTDFLYSHEFPYYENKRWTMK